MASHTPAWALTIFAGAQLITSIIGSAGCSVSSSCCQIHAELPDVNLPRHA